MRATTLATGLAAALAIAGPAAARPAAGDAPVSSGLAPRLAAPPLAFETDRGQLPPGMRYAVRGPGFAAGLHDRGAVVRTAPAEHVRLEFAGARRRPVAQHRLRGHVNVLVGRRERWRTAVPTYARVRYPRVWPGIDVVFYGNGTALEYDLRVAPGADPRRAIVVVRGARSVRIAPDGAAVARTATGTLRLQRPVAYQLRDGRRRAVAARFALRGRRLGVAVGDYDRSRALIIDPSMVLATYLGGGDADFGTAVGTDGAGNVVIAGTTSSTDLAVTPGALQGTNQGGSNNGYDVWVGKFSPTGERLFTTYLGGTDDDEANDIAVDQAGNAYLTGITFSGDFPTTAGVVKPSFTPSGPAGNAFATKLDASGSGLAHSTYLGGATAAGHGIAIDAAGAQYVTGTTSTADFPVTAGAAQTAFRGTSGLATNAFIAKLAPGATTLTYATYLSGSGNGTNNRPLTAAFDIAVDAAGSAYVAGDTDTTDFPVTPNAMEQQRTRPTNGFAAKLTPTGNAFEYATYLTQDSASGIALAAGGRAMVTGRDGTLVYVARLTPSGGALDFATQLGAGTGDAVAVDSRDVAYVAGRAASGFAPTADAAQTAFGGGPGDGFLASVDPGGAMLYATFLGGTGADQLRALAVAGSDTVWAAGDTDSTDHPTVGALQAANAGGADAVLAAYRFPFAAPVNDEPPGIDGVPRPGATLTCLPGRWRGSQLDFSHRFLRNGLPIDGSASASYVVTDADLGTEIRCQEFATNPGGQASATSGALVPARGAPVALSAPTVSGTPAVGSEVRCNPGLWDPPARQFTYRWIGYDGYIREVERAQGPSLVLTQRVPDVDPLWCEVTATNDVGQTTARSQQVHVVASVPHVVYLPSVRLENTGPRPTDARVICEPGTWAWLPEPKYSYEWTRNGTPIPNEIGSAYQVTVDDLGRDITCVVRAINAKGVSEPHGSPAVLVPLPARDGAVVRARRGFNRLDPSSFVAISSEYTELVGPLLQERFQAALDAYPERCARYAEANRTILDDLRPGPPSESTPLRVAQADRAVVCEILRLAPDRVHVTPEGVIYQPHKILSCDERGSNCRKLPIGSPDLDPARPPALPFDVAERARAHEPRQVLWDFNSDRRVDLVCPAGAPVARTLFNRGRYQVSALIVDAQSEATGRYSGGSVSFDFFKDAAAGRSAAATRQAPRDAAGLVRRFGLLGGGGLETVPAGTPVAPSDGLRVAQPMTCRTSVDPPVEVARPCITDGRMGKVTLRGNLCPVSSRRIDDDELGGLPRPVLEALEAAAEAREAAGARAAAARAAGDGPRFASFPAFGLRVQQVESNVAAVAGALADAATPPAKPDFKGTARRVFAVDQGESTAAFALDQILVARGVLHVNGIELRPREGTSTLIVPSDVGKAIDAMRRERRMLISARAVQQRLDELRLSNGAEPMKVEVKDHESAPDQRIASINLSDAIDLGPLDAIGETEAFITSDGRARVKTKASFPNVFATPTGKPITVDLDLSADNAGEIRLDEIEIDIEEAHLLALEVEDLRLKYEREHGLFEASGDIRLTPIGPGIGIKRFALENKQLKALVIELVAPPPGIPLFPSIFLTRFGGGFERGSRDGHAQFDPARNAITLVASGEVAVGPSAAGCAPASLDLELRARFAPVLDLKANSGVKVLCIPLFDAEFTARGDGFVSLGAKVDVELGPLFVRAALLGQLQLPKWQVGMEGEVGVRDIPVIGRVSARGRAVASNLGLAGCVGVDLPWPVGEVAAGAGVKFPSSGQLPSSVGALAASLRIFTGCDLGPFQSFARLARAAQNGARSFEVGRDEGGLLLSVEGAGGAPRFVLKDPTGATVIDASADDEGKRTDRALAMRFPHEDRTVVSVRGAPAGRWTIEPADGSVAIRDVQRSRPVPRPRISARVGGLGASRVLRYAVAPIDGQEVRFVEAGKRGGRTIARVRRGGRGTVRYVAGEAEGRARTVVAEISQDGMPRESRVVARYSAPNPRLPAPRVRARRRGSRVVVTFAPSPRARHHLVELRAGDGTVASADPGRRRRVVFRGIPRGAAVQATVVPYTGAGRRGRAGRARLAGAARYVTEPRTFVRARPRAGRTRQR